MRGEAKIPKIGGGKTSDIKKMLRRGKDSVSKFLNI